MNFFQKSTLLGLTMLVGISSVSARDASFSLPSQKLNMGAHSLVSKVSSPSGKSWLISRFKYLSEEFSRAKKLTGDRKDARGYQDEIMRDINAIIVHLENNAYNFDISDSLRNQVESDVLSYQKEFAEVVKKYLTDALMNGFRETGDMHFTFKSPETNMDIHIISYRVTTSQDKKNLELDAKIAINVDTGKDHVMSGTIDGNITLIGSDLYFTLRDYSISLSSMGAATFVNYEDTIKEIKGKTYHVKLNDAAIRPILMNREDTDKIVKKSLTVLDILSQKSLLTPVAQEGGDTILVFKKDTLLSLADIFSEFLGSVDASDINTATFADIRTDGKIIKLTAYNNANIHVALSRNADKTPLFRLEARERGIKNPTSLMLAKNPEYWALAASDGKYAVDAQATSTGAMASIKEGDKVIATAKISSTGVRAWTYDASAKWEDNVSDWDDGNSDAKDTFAMHFWGALRQEFSNFILTPPSISEEFEKTKMGAEYAKELRDNERISQLSSILTALEDYYDDNGSYPRPKNGCLDIASIQSYLPNTFSTGQIALPTDTCQTGYYYNTIVIRTHKIPLLAARMELIKSANYDNSKTSISKIKNSSQIHYLYSDTANTSDIQSWLYVIPGMTGVGPFTNL